MKVFVDGKLIDASEVKVVYDGGWYEGKEQIKITLNKLGVVHELLDENQNVLVKDDASLNEVGLCLTENI